MKSTRSRRHVLVMLGYNDHDFMRGILAYARDADWSLDTNYNRIGLPPDRSTRFDGMIGVVGKRQEIEIFRAHSPLPYVDLSGAWLWDLKDPAARRVGRVTYDPAALGQTAAEHLAGRGLKTLAFVNTSDGWHERPCLAAIAAVARKAHAQFIEIPFHRELPVVPSYSAVFEADRAMRWLENALRTLPKPCGLVVVDDWAPSVVRACEQIPVAVPHEVAVIGLYNLCDLCEYATIPISAVNADFAHIAYEGSRLLDRLMRGARVPKRPILIQPKGVVIRQSTDVLAVNHPDVAAALRFIWDHFREPLGARDVVSRTGLSYQGLARAFRNQIGHSVVEEIARKRIEETKRLLCETNLKAWQIAEQSGFSGVEHFCRAFKRSVGEPPAAYRRKRQFPRQKQT